MPHMVSTWLKYLCVLQLMAYMALHNDSQRLHYLDRDDLAKQDDLYTGSIGIAFEHAHASISDGRLHMHEFHVVMSSLKFDFSISAPSALPIITDQSAQMAASCR